MPSRTHLRARALVAAGFATFSALFLTGIARAETPPEEPTSAAAAASQAPEADAAPAPDAPAKAPGPVDPAAGKPARPPLPPDFEPEPLPWERTLDVGGDFAIVARPATTDVKGRPSRIRYQAATGFALRVRWPILKQLQVEAYFIDCHLPVQLPGGSLGLAGHVTSPPVESFVFGTRISPTLTWGALTGWLTAGVGWGRFEFPRMQVRAPSGATYTVRERGASFVEFPVGFGVSWEVVPKWFSIDIQTTAAFVAGQHGEAFDEAQTVDDTGHLRNVGPLPVMDASIVQTIGLSLLL